MPVRPLPCVPHGICRPAEQARQSLSSLSKLSLEDFRNVEQSANAARNAQKAKYQGMLSLYLSVIYQIIKNMCISTPAMLPPLFHSVCFSYLHDFCHPLFLPFSRKTYRKFFVIWEDFRTPFSFVPAVPLLSAYQQSDLYRMYSLLYRKTSPASLATGDAFYLFMI